MSVLLNTLLSVGDIPGLHPKPTTVIGAWCAFAMEPPPVLLLLYLWGEEMSNLWYEESSAAHFPAGEVL